jgi:hypothetical protein
LIYSSDEDSQFEDEAAIEAAWDELLTSEASLLWLNQAGAKALADLDAGLTDEIEPDEL